MFSFHVYTNSFEILELSITQCAQCGSNKGSIRMDSSKVPRKIWPGFDNGIANATIKWLALGVFTNYRHRMNVIAIGCFVFFNTMNTEATLRIGDKFTFFTTK
jgi:hypothetical protein